MDFNIPSEYLDDLERFEEFLGDELTPHLRDWYKGGEIPRSFFEAMGRSGWLGYQPENGGWAPQPSLKQALLFEALARISPGVAVAVLVQTSLGCDGLRLAGDGTMMARSILDQAVRGELLLCVGNTELLAGSDVASISMEAKQVDGGFLLNGTKAYVTNGNLGDMALMTAVTDPESERNRRLSLFLVDLNGSGVSRKKLHKQVWIPSDLTRIRLDNAFVPEFGLLGERGRGLQKILEIFTNSRITISALTMGTAKGAFQLALDHGRRRKIFGQRLIDLQSKSFEAADLYARMEAAWLTVLKASWYKDQGRDFRIESSMAKYLSVEVATQVSHWAADLFGAASVIFEHPIHKFPMDAWAAGLGEGTQDVQKLIISRAII